MWLLCALVLLVTVSACSIGNDPDASGPPPSTSSPSSPDPSTTPEPPETAQPDASGTPACTEVRAGIDAFNDGDFAGTVDHFVRALPLARAQARARPSKAADDLLEAVRYYAELAPDDYPQSAASSSEFAKYKAITLGQCVVARAPTEPDPTRSPGVTT